MNRIRFLLPAVAVILIAALAVLPSCTEPGPSVSGSDSSAVSEKIPFEGDFSIKIGGETFRPTLKNCEPEGDEIVLYDSGYLKDGKISVYYTLQAPDRTVIGYSPEMSGGELCYNIFALSDEVGFRCPIPYSGFLISVPSKLIEGLRVRKGQLAKTEGADRIPLKEVLQQGSFYPESEYSAALERRIDLTDPRVSLPADGSGNGKGRIYYFSSAYDGGYRTLPEEGIVVRLEKNTNRSSKVTGISRSDRTEAGEEALVFLGEYNMAYAESVLEVGMKLFLNQLDRVSSLSDSPAVYLNGVLYTFGDETVNCGSTDGEGVYAFTGDYGSLSAPRSSSGQRDVVIVNDTVVDVGEKNTPVMIPLNGGIVLSFTGSKADAVSGVAVGQVAETVQLNSEQISGNAVRIGDVQYTYDKKDEIRAPEGVSVLYTPSYGKTTGANPYGLEIAVTDGVVTAVEIGKGDMAIPENGYVLSIHKDAEQYDSAQSVKVGETAVSYRSGIGYSMETASVDKINNVRSENTLVVYRNQKRTGTNAYGYEIAVDSEKRMVDQGYAGNMEIPAGGYVLSAHGSKVSFLESVYCRGALAVFDEKNMRVAVISTPETNLYDAEQSALEIASEVSSAKSRLLNVDYDRLDERVRAMNDALAEAKEGYAESDYQKALSGLETVRNIRDGLTYSMIESHAVENRAVWYRSTEKNDAEVEATVRKMKELNVNAVYLETWYNGRFTGYSENELILHTTAQNGDYDVLEGFVRICHENGIQVHAWVENFFIGTLEAQEQANTNLSGHFKGRWLIDQNGADTFYYATSNTHFIFLNPYDAEVQQFLLDFYAEMLRNYDIDGIHLDYIRFPEKNGNATFGYNDDIVKAWQKENNTQIHPSTLSAGALMNSWNKFRQSIVNGFVQRVFETVKKTDPSSWLSAAVYPGIPDIKNVIFQDCANWVENGYVDELFSMTYSGESAYVSQNARQFASLCGDKCFYSTGLMAFDETVETEFGKQMTVVRSAGADGVAVFSLANLKPTNYYTPIKEGAFREESVQATLLNETVAAQIGSILDQAENVWLAYGGAEGESVDALRGLLTPILQKAESFEAEKDDLKARIRYCESVISELETARESALRLFESPVRSVLSARFGDLVHWMTVTKNRLSARQ